MKHNNDYKVDIYGDVLRESINFIFKTVEDYRENENKIEKLKKENETLSEKIQKKQTDIDYCLKRILGEWEEEEDDENDENDENDE